MQWQPYSPPNLTTRIPSGVLEFAVRHRCTGRVYELGSSSVFVFVVQLSRPWTPKIFCSTVWSVGDISVDAQIDIGMGITYGGDDKRKKMNDTYDKSFVEEGGVWVEDGDMNVADKKWLWRFRK